MEEKDSLASELLHLVKTQARRWFIAFIVVLIMLFATNLAWLYAWNLPDDVTSESYDINAEDELDFEDAINTAEGWYDEDWDEDD